MNAESQFEMSWIDKLRLLAEIGPVLAKLQLAFSTDDPHRQTLALIQAAGWAAGRTETEADDEAVAHLEAVMRTAEGKAFFHWAVEKLGMNEDE